MTAFVVIAAIMVAAALAWVLVPLLRRPHERPDLAREASNLAILKHQLAELETDRNAGTLSDTQYQQAKADVERRVLEEAAGATQTAAVALPKRGRWTAVAVGVTLPVLAIALYLQLGGLDAFAPQKQPEQHVTREQIEGMVAGLAARLEREPNDARGWSVLAQSYYVMQRFPEAARAYAKLSELVPDNADVLADYADSLAMAQGRKIAGMPLDLARRALKIDPNQWKALALVASEAFERKDYKTAIAYWEQLQGVAPADSELAKAIAENIAEARELAGGAKAAAASGPIASIKGTVTLLPALAGRADPTDTVFIFARAPEGPRMPIAVVRRQVKDLPATFTLDDSQAMMPTMKLSSFKEVVVGARVSKSADAIPRSGDLQGQSAPVKVGATNVSIVINAIVP